MKYNKRLQQKRDYRKYQEDWQRKATDVTSWLNLPDPGTNEFVRKVKRFANEDGSVSAIKVKNGLNCVGLRRCATLDFIRDRHG